MNFYVYGAYFLTLTGFALFASVTWVSLKKARQVLLLQETRKRNVSQA